MTQPIDFQAARIAAARAEFEQAKAAEAAFRAACNASGDHSEANAAEMKRLSQARWDAGCKLRNAEGGPLLIME